MKIDKDNIYFTTGQFAKMCKLNKKTLFYYDEIDLFKPAYIEENGYRYYCAYQLDLIALIISLKDLGMSLNDIKKYLSISDIKQLNKELIKQKNEIANKINQLNETKNFLSKIIDFNNEFQDNLHNSFYIQYRKKEYYEIFFDFKQQNNKNSIVIINYLTDGFFTGRCIKPNQHFIYKKCLSSSLYKEEGNYLCLYVLSDNNIDNYIEQIKQYANDNNIILDNTFYIEINDILHTSNDFDKSYYCISSHIKKSV